MGETCILFGVSQSSLIFQQPKLSFRFSHHSPSHLSFRRQFNPLSAISSSDSPLITVSNPISSKEDFDTTGGGGGADLLGGSGGGGGGGGSGGGGEGTGGESEDHKKKMEWSLSQKLTIGFAAIVGIGGIMGYIKSGSKMSLTAGGVSAAALYFVFTQLPVHPVLASSIGLGVSAVLMGVMGSRFKKSGKIFPAGVVSLTSLIMAGGYVHGIIRTLTH